jgi:hypothetical protein
LESPELNINDVRFYKTDVKVNKHLTQAYLIVKDKCQAADFLDDKHKFFFFESEPNVVYEQMPSVPASARDKNKYDKAKKTFGLKNYPVDMTKDTQHFLISGRSEFKWTRWMFPSEVVLTNKVFSSKKTDNSIMALPIVIAGAVHEMPLEMTCRQDFLTVRFFIAVSDTMVRIQQSPRSSDKQSYARDSFAYINELVNNSSKKKKKKNKSDEL